jgi:hypothetical protein
VKTRHSWSKRLLATLSECCGGCLCVADEEEEGRDVDEEAMLL